MAGHLFSDTPPPWPNVTNGVTRRCLTWSSETRRTLHELSRELPHLPPPQLAHFSQHEYGYTLLWDVQRDLNAKLRKRLTAIAIALHRLPHFSNLILFDHLMDDVIDGATIRGLFAYIRSALVQETSDDNVAIYAPLGVVGGTAQKDFPLHADLYPPVFLFNVFDRVPRDGSGASLFLPMHVVRNAVEHNSLIPKDVKSWFRHLIAHPSNTDHYEQFYDFLHGDKPWSVSLLKEMQSATVRISLGRGQGYLVHDRRWLHGREAPSGRVLKDRLHRLIFDSNRTLRARLRACQELQNHIPPPDLDVTK
jgi:hypothetical protein